MATLEIIHSLDGKTPKDIQSLYALYEKIEGHIDVINECLVSLLETADEIAYGYGDHLVAECKFESNALVINLGLA